MSKLFVTSDTHFNHAKLTCGPPEILEYAEKWNATVRSEDTVIHLGDVIFARASQLSDINLELAGSKILVRGNHDRQTNRWYRTHGFSGCFSRLEIGNLIFTHKPLMWVRWGRTNWHGHLHSSEKSHRKGGGADGTA